MKTFCFLILLLVSLSTAHAQCNDTLYKQFSDSIFYPCDKIKLSNSFIDWHHISKDSIHQIVIFLNRHPDFVVEIACHTDQRGNNYYNQRLSEKRAEYIITILVSDYKVARYQLYSCGYGETQLIHFDEEILEEQDREKREYYYQQNRRMELVILKTD